MAERNQERVHTKEKLRNTMQRRLNMKVNLEFCELMNPSETNSLGQQVQSSYPDTYCWTFKFQCARGLGSCVECINLHSKGNDSNKMG